MYVPLIYSCPADHVINIIIIIVEGTTYNHGRPEGISEDWHSTNQFLDMLRAGPPYKDTDLRDHPRGSSLPTSPDPAP